MTQTALAWIKDEIVYVNMDARGTDKSVYVVNRFEVNGAETVVDYGAYSEVANLTNLDELTVLGDEVRVAVNNGTFYYQGKAAHSAVPWIVDIAYRLDGRFIEPDALAGQSGHVEIEIDVRQNPAADASYFENYLVQMSVTLDTESQTNIVAGGASEANAGTDRVLTYMVLPESEKAFTIEMDAREFELAPIALNAIPMNMDVDGIDTEEIKDKVHALQDGISQVDDGAASLRKGIRQLGQGATTVSQASGEVASGVKSLADGGAQLTQASGDIKAGIDRLAGGLAQLDASAQQIAEGGAALTGGAQALSGGLGELNDQFAGLVQASSGIQGAIDALLGAANGVSGDVGNVKKLLGVVSDYPEITSGYGKYIASARSIVGTIEGLQSGLDDLSRQYAAFHAALAECQAAIARLNAASGELAGQTGTYVGALNQFTGAVNQSGASASAKQLAAAYAEFHASLNALTDALAQLDGEYAKLHAGIEALDENTAKLNNGAGKLKRGADELNEQTADMDAQIDEEVDDALAKFRNDDFAPTSFADARNDVRLVQFVMRTDAIEAPEVEAPEETEAAAERSFWDRVGALFQ